MDGKEFSSYLSSIYSQGMIMVGLGIGHELGLIQLLCDATTPMSPQEIADKLHLKERYTREWLSGMAAAKILNIDRETGSFTLPDTYKEDLKLRAAFAPALFTFCGRKNMLKNCFKEEGPYGYEYEEDTSWFDWFDTYRSGMCDYTIDTEILPRLQEQGIVASLESGIKMLDIGSGVGNYTLALAERFPNSHFTGLEYCKKAVQTSLEKLEKNQLKNVTFVNENALQLPESMTDSFDWVFVYDTLHDLPDPEKALDEIYKVMKSDAKLSIVEMGFHANPADNAGNLIAAMYYMCSMFICLPSSMSAPPHIGYGACWGIEKLKELLDKKKFKTLDNSSFVSTGAKVFVVCSK